MKLEPESTTLIAKKFTDQTDERLSDLIEQEIGGTRQLDDREFGDMRDGLQDAVAEMLGRLEVADGED